MTCAECQSLLSTADMRALGASDVASATIDDERGEAVSAAALGHLAACARCSSAVALIGDAERTLAVALDREATSRPATGIAEHAWRTAQRRRVHRRIAVVAAALLLAGGWLAVERLGPELMRLTSAPPPVVTETFSLTCLSTEQAGSLVRAYIPRPENPRWQAERFGVDPAGEGIRAITVRAPRAVIDRVPALLERFERDPNAACRRENGGGPR